MEQNTPGLPEGQPVRRRRRPAMASPAQKLGIFAMALVAAFLLGILAGMALAHNAWVTEAPRQENHMPEEPPRQTVEQTEPMETQPIETEPEQTTEETTKATEETAEPSAPPAVYILPTSDSAYLTQADFAHLSDWELILARNEIFARHGRTFQDADIQAYFDGCDWYEGTVVPEDFDTSVLNDMELANISVLKAAYDAR